MPTIESPLSPSEPLPRRADGGIDYAGYRALAGRLRGEAMTAPGVAAGDAGGAAWAGTDGGALAGAGGPGLA